MGEVVEGKGRHWVEEEVAFLREARKK